MVKSVESRESSERTHQDIEAAACKLQFLYQRQEAALVLWESRKCQIAHIERDLKGTKALLEVQQAR